MIAFSAYVDLDSSGPHASKRCAPGVAGMQPQPRQHAAKPSPRTRPVAGGLISHDSAPSFLVDAVPQAPRGLCNSRSAPSLPVQSRPPLPSARMPSSRTPSPHIRSRPCGHGLETSQKPLHAVGVPTNSSRCSSPRLPASVRSDFNHAASPRTRADGSRPPQHAASPASARSRSELPCYTNLRRSFSAPPAVLAAQTPTTPVEVCPKAVASQVGYSAIEWDLAVCPSKMEQLRRCLASAHAEVASFRRQAAEDDEARVAYEAALKGSRRRIRELRQEEQEFKMQRSGASSASWNRSLPTQRLAESMRTETEALARKVSRAALILTAQCRALRDLRAAKDLTRLRSEVHQARRRIVAVCRGYRHEVGISAAAVAALQAQTRELRHEVGNAEGEALAAAASGRATWAAPEETVAQLRAELASEERGQRVATEEDATEVAAQAALRRQAVQLASRLAEVQAGAEHLAEGLRHAEDRDSVLRMALERARSSVSKEISEAKARTATCAMLEAELMQQRCTTNAWRHSASALVTSHEDISAEAGSAAQVCRFALRNGSVDAIDEPGLFCESRIDMARFQASAHDGPLPLPLWKVLERNVTAGARTGFVGLEGGSVTWAGMGNSAM